MHLEGAGARVLDGATSMFVAVDTKRGPHVTADLFVNTDDRLWSFTAADTVKVRTLRRRPHAGVLVRDGDDAVVMATRVTVVDAAQPLRAVTSGAALDVPRVTTAFATKHALEIAGGAADYAAGRFGLLPGRWVLLSFEPVATAVIEAGHLSSALGWGDVASPDLPDDEGEEIAVDLDAIPEAVRHLLRSSDAALGWYSAHGPLALPAGWSLDESVAAVDAELFEATGCGSEGPVAVTVDEWVAPGPGGKRGVMVRGNGRARRDGERVLVDVVPDRAVAWDGTDTGSVGGIREMSTETGHTADVSDPKKDPKKETRAG